MPELVWYRSLYWRIALGFVALLAALLAAQGTAFLWLTGRMSEILPGRSPAEYSQLIATDLVATLSEKPDAELDDYLNEKYTGTYRPFVVVTRDNRTVVSRRIQPPPMLVRAAYGRLNEANGMGRGGPGSGRDGGFGFGGRDGNSGNPGGLPSQADRAGGPGTGASGSSPAQPVPPPVAGGTGGAQPETRVDGSSQDRGPNGDRGRSGRGFDRFGRAGGRPGGFGAGGPGGPGGDRGGDRGPDRGQQTFVFAPVVINDATFAMVAVPSEAPPLSAALRNLGPTLGIVAAGLLITGSAVGALLIFRPTRRRLRTLQDAAQAIGAGELTARAPESGGDEVAMLAHTFNEMAGGLEERTRALVAVNESRRQLLADVSHELMTPLAAIRGYVETMTMADVKLTDATRQRYLGIVADETERLEHIIGDLLDLARVEGGGGTWKREAVSVRALFERVLNRHEPLLARRGVTLATHVAPDVTDVTGDPNRLEQALQNLAANAVRHTPEGGRVTLTAVRADGGTRLAVEDTGPGIPPEHLPHIFERFYKVDVSRTGTIIPSGSGLGLSIVQAIVQRHGGTITASNATSGGARFEIVLPDERPQGR
ncbi:MAG TPA: HAMP domain-containing sensor histidine kinase [Vicinamibacterales bacterium]|nr:HAMP domain-containing sensor histidine kinase [Vicinamibacterales bacterium]